MRSAGVWHRPALSPDAVFCEIFCHNIGEIRYPTRTSRIWRACCARTVSILMTPARETACFSAGSVTSWKMMRFVVSTGSSNTLQICHAMASPSRSSSAANMTSLALAIAERSLDTCCRLLSIRVNLGSKLFSTSMFSSPLSSRICPKLATHLYPAPKYFSIFAHFAGDSTISNVYDIMCICHIIMFTFNFIFYYILFHFISFYFILFHKHVKQRHHS